MSAALSLGRVGVALPVVVLAGLAILGGAHAEDSHDVSARAVSGGYSGPFATGGTWTAGFAKAKALVAQMTIDEKVAVLTGADGFTCTGNTAPIPRLNLRSLCLQDGPSGIHDALNVTQFASQVTVAATWNADLAAAHAAALGAEFYAKGINIMYGPITGGPLGRSPLCGRTSEGFGSDEYLHGTMAYRAVQATQASGTIVNLKHWIGYEQETDRGQRTLFTHTQPVSANMDDATLHHLYQWPFAEGVRAGAGTVMCSYNRVNGTHSCENDDSLNRILKGELNFQGSVVSDYGAVWNLEASVNHGLDVNMPGESGKMFGITLFPDEFGKHGSKLAAAVQAGAVSEARIDDMLLRLLAPVMQYQDLDTMPQPSIHKQGLTGPTPDPRNVQADHYKVVRQVGLESVTLLKNVKDGGRGLPLKAAGLTKLAVAGRDAVYIKPLLCDPVGRCEQMSTVTDDTGSGHTFPPYIVDPLSAIQTYLQGKPVTITSAPDKRDFDTAETNARGADAALVFVSVLQNEGDDRKDLSLDDDGAELVRRVASANANTVVVIHAPAAVDMESFVEHPNVTAILYAYYPGQESGNGLVPILFGDVAPSGKLPFVIGKSLSDWPPGTIATGGEADFTEGSLIDWKWMDTKGIEPRFPFGFGLSYTTFAYGPATIATTFQADNTSVQPTNERFVDADTAAIPAGGKSLYDIVQTVTVPVTNTGKMAGAEVAQLYLSYPPETPNMPAHVLRGFTKLHLRPGQTRNATFALRRKDLSVWDVVRQAWVVPGGTFTFFVGGSSGGWEKEGASKVLDAHGPIESIDTAIDSFHDTSSELGASAPDNAAELANLPIGHLHSLRVLCGTLGCYPACSYCHRP